MANQLDIKTVAVIGAGTMGSGIAQVCALAGYHVQLFDVEASAVGKGLQAIKNNLAQGVEKGKIDKTFAEQIPKRITPVENLAALKADLLIEAIVEKLDVKRKVFQEVERTNPKAILATNTSSISVTQIASALNDPSKLVGIHFFNPAHIMKLVEVISGAATSEATAQQAREFALSLDKVPVMAKDSPGFIVNRVARHFYVESLKVLEENIADIETIDRLMEASGFKMGPFRLMDLIGVDTNFSVTTSMYNAFHQDPKFRPSRIQQQKVDAGEWGRKTGKGFYDYSKG
ncbi:MAG: 3-hydroxyacyl-CoA dehydrogenase NAD-binding domain-containing protein [Cyclobacteriaceae bacterium]